MLTAAGCTPLLLQHLAWQYRMLRAVLHHYLTIHNDIIDPVWKLVWRLERGPVAYCCRIKNGDVRCLACRQDTPVAEPELGRSHRSHFAYPVCQGDHAFLTDVFAQHTWEGAVCPRMRL